ncbi:MAG: vWA domain-containing protein [Thermoleophilia bacterium]
MRQGYTHISVILDRTGSMEPIRDDIIEGFNAFLVDQRNLPGTASMTLVQFDSVDPYEIIHHFKLLAAVSPLTRDTYVPRAATPLLDAIGRGINDLDETLAEIAENDRPEHIVVVVITDGQENASKEFRKDTIIKMVTRHQEEFRWQFVFLSADLDSIKDAISYGMHHSSVIAFDKSARGVADVIKSSSHKISIFRSGMSKGVSFSQEDRDRQDSEKRRDDETS